MISRILNRNSALGDTFRLFAMQLLLVAIIATAMLAVQVGTASADTGTAYTGTGSQTTCDLHNDPDCASDELGASGSIEMETLVGQSGADSDNPYQNNSGGNTGPNLDDDTSSGQCLLPGIPC